MKAARIRIDTKTIRSAIRSTETRPECSRKGVKLLNLDPNDRIAAAVGPRRLQARGEDGMLLQ